MSKKNKRALKQRVSAHSVERHHMALAAARLRTEKKTQEQISKFLDRSQADVSRLLDFAKSKGWYEDQPRLKMENIPPEDWYTTEQKYFVDFDLGEICRHWAPGGMKVDIRIFPSTPPHLSDFFNLAATRLLQLIHRCRTFGVMYGYNVHQLKDALSERQLHMNKTHDPNFVVVPLCGDPTHMINTEWVQYTASNLAANFYEILTGESAKGKHTLRGVPAYTARHFTLTGEEGELGSLQSFIHSIPGYQYIFGGPSGSAPSGSDEDLPLIHKLDGLITGTGIIQPDTKTIENVRATFIRERLEQETGLPLDYLRELIHGDLGGVLIEKDGLGKRDLKMVQDLNKCWVGMTQQHLKNIAAQANATKNKALVGKHDESMPGVILMAYEAAKAEMIKVLIQRGFINHLIINDDLAGALKTLGERDLPSTKK